MSKEDKWIIGSGKDATSKIRTEKIENQYAQNLFLDAYDLCRDIYSNIDGLKTYATKDILLIGRLAGRLGGITLRDRIFDIARKKDPLNPLVLYYAGKGKPKDAYLLVRLEEMKTFPFDDFENSKDKAAWLSTMAWGYALVRDFEKAHHYLDTATKLNSERAWVKSCMAEVYCLEDRWKEALPIAERAWELAPGMPQSASTLGKILGKLGDLPGVVETLLPVALEKQSFETLITATWYVCALAERSPQIKCETMAHEALTYVERLKTLAPLGDKDFQSDLSRISIDIAWLLNDHPKMRSHAKAIEHPFYERILKNISEKNLDSDDSPQIIMTDYHPFYQKHNTCLPTSVASVLSHFKIDIDADALSKELTYHGTAMWRVTDWLKSRELIVKPFIATGDIVQTLLKNRLPFVLNFKSVHYYHAMAAIGLDEAAGVLLIHDPSNIRLDKMLLSEIGSEEVPFGNEALAMVPKEKAHLLDLIPETASNAYTAFVQFQKIRDTSGLKHSLPVIEALKDKDPDNPFVLRMEAIYMGFKGETAKAIDLQKSLLATYPECEHIRQELLSSLYQTGNRGLIRDVLSRIVMKKKLPGMRAAQKWHYPPAEYVAQYASYAGVIKSGYPKAIQMLRKSLKRDGTHAASYHVLGDLYSQMGDIKMSLIPYRCAATLEIENHHYARAYVEALARMDQLDKGIAFLKNRTEKLGGSVAGGDVFITLISTLEDYGYPGKAISALQKAQQMRPSDERLLSYAVSFWGRLGQKELEKRSLAALKKSHHPASFFSAAVSYHQMNGRWQKALRFAKKWLEEVPDNTDARRTYAELFSVSKGMNETLILTTQWKEAYPGNDALEMLHYDYAKALFRDDLQLEILRARIKRNPYDLWAYRELAFTLIYVMDIGEKRDMSATRKELEGIIQKCRELSDETSILYVLQAELAAFDGKFKIAIAHTLKAIRNEPDYTYAYRKAWQYAAKLSEASRQRVFKQMERSMLGVAGFLSLSKDLSEMAAEVFGIQKAHERVDAWALKFPKDPEIIKTKTSLLLDYGMGKSDAERAVVLLKKEIQRFPNHGEFKFLLSKAYRILQDEEKWLSTSREILTQFPLSNIQRRQLAEFYELKQTPQKALKLLCKGVSYTPLDEWVRFDLMALLFRMGKTERALSFTQKSLKRIPESIGFRNRVVSLLFDYGEDEMAVSVAKEGTKIYPDGSNLWKNYGNALWRSRTTSDLKAVETVFLKALHLNPRYLEVADHLSELYTYQNNFEKAKAIISAQKPYHAEQGELLTRLAWIEREAGNEKAAVTQLLKVLKEWPRERWAWNLLIVWIKEDENWELAQTVLRDVHPVMATDPDFVSDKLYVLHKAGIKDAGIDKEWEKLLSDFPENEKIHCLRFDMLMDEESLEAADRILTAIEPYDPSSPYLLARRASLSADQGEFEKAVESTLQLMSLPYDVGAWCQQSVWKSFQDYHKIQMLIEAAMEEWLKGRTIEPTFFRMMLSDIETFLKAPGIIPRLLMKLGIRPGQVKALEALCPKAIERDTPDGAYTAAILDRIADYGFPKRLIAFSKAYPEFAHSRTQVWQIIGYAYAIGPKGKSNEARAWLSSWPDHQSCDMWVVSNYIVAILKSPGLKRTQKLQLIFENAKEALERLPSDHTLQYIIAKYCEAALRLKKDTIFLETVEQFKNILEDTESGYWKRDGEGELPMVILLFKKLITSHASKAKAKTLTQTFKAEIDFAAIPDWVYPEWKARLKVIKKIGK